MDTFQKLGLVIILGFILYLVYFYYNKKQNKVENFDVHGGSNTAQISASISESAAKQSDILLISKYRKDYDVFIDNMKKYVGANIIRLMLQVDASQSDIMSDANLKIFTDINTLKLSFDSLHSIQTTIIDVFN